MGATRRHPLRQPRPRSPALRALYRSGAWGWGLVRRDRAGMTALMSRCARQARRRRRPTPGPRSDRTAACPSKPPPGPGPGCGCGAGPVTHRPRGRPRRSARIWIWVRKPPRLRPRAGCAYFFGGAHVRVPDRAVPPHGGSIQISLQMGLQARPSAPVAPGRLAAIDRVPLPVRGRPLAPIRALPRNAATKRQPRASSPTRITDIHKRTDAEPLGIGHRGNAPRDGYPKRSPLARKRQSTSTLPSLTGFPRPAPNALAAPSRDCTAYAAWNRGQEALPRYHPCLRIASERRSRTRGTRALQRRKFSRLSLRKK